MGEERLADALQPLGVNRELGVEVTGDDRRGVRADADEARVPDRELAGHPVDDVEAERDDDVDHREHRDLPPRRVGQDLVESELEPEHGPGEEHHGEDAALNGGHAAQRSRAGALRVKYGAPFSRSTEARRALYLITRR